MAEAKAKVWNDHTEDHVEEFKGEMIRIPAKGHIEMYWSDAEQFKGQYTPIIRDGMGRDLKPKMVRLEKIDAVAQAEKAKLVCPMDGRSFDTQDALDAHIAEKHVDQMLDEEAQKKFRAKAK